MRILLAFILAGCAIAQQPRWVATWAFSPAPQLATDAEMRAARLVFDNQTLRQFVRTSIGGETARVRLSNVYGKDVLEIGEVRMALRDKAANTVAGSDVALTFSGRGAMAIPPGAVMISDPVKFSVPADGDVAISIFLPGTAAGAGIHYSASATSYIGAGNQAAAAAFRQTTTVASWAFLAGLDVAGPETAGVIVTFGDSITDGARSTADTNRRWPNFLAQRLLAANMTDLAVVDSGIGGNRILHDPATAPNARYGVNALARFERDVLAQPGARYVVILEGINDLGHPGSATAPASEAVTADDVIAGLKQMADRAHEMGLKVIGATITPFGGYTAAGYYTPEKERYRVAINQWIRTTDSYDDYIDFEKVVQDPEHPDKILAAYDSGDHLHPGDAGYKAMAEAIDLSMFQGPAAGAQGSRRRRFN